MIQVAVNGYGTIGKRVADAVAAQTVSTIVDIIGNHPRMGLVKGSTGISSTAELTEYIRDLGRPRADMWENGIFEDPISVDGKKISFFQAVRQEANVVAETVDATRAAVGAVKDPEVSIRMTDNAMGIPPSDEW